MDPKDREKMVEAVVEELKPWYKEQLDDIKQQQDERCQNLEAEMQKVISIVAALQHDIRNGFKEDIIKALLEAQMASNEATRAANDLKLHHKINTSERRWGVADKILDHALKATGVGGIIYLIIQVIISRVG